MEGEVGLRVVVVRPPHDVWFAVQRGKAELVEPALRTDDETSFELTVRVGDGRPDGLPNFLGPFTHGPPAGRFVYVTSGTLAGQRDSCWTRRAKVHLSGITWEMIEAVLAGAAEVLEARFLGAARDGGPACATVPLLDGGWRVAPGRLDAGSSNRE
jgi:hypothetical protein